MSWGWDKRCLTVGCRETVRKLARLPPAYDVQGIRFEEAYLERFFEPAFFGRLLLLARRTPDDFTIIACLHSAQCSTRSKTDIL